MILVRALLQDGNAQAVDCTCMLTAGVGLCASLRPEYTVSAYCFGSNVLLIWQQYKHKQLLTYID
jgi:hypothetical protein